MERPLRNMSQEDAKESGWEVLKPLNCEVVGKAIFKDGDIEIMKSTKRFPVFSAKQDPEGGYNHRIGYIYNTSTEYRRGDNVSVAEAMVFVPEA